MPLVAHLRLLTAALATWLVIAPVALLLERADRSSAARTLQQRAGAGARAVSR